MTGKFEAFVVRASNTLLDHPEWRIGQAHMNALWEVDPSAWQDATGPVDCYDDDTRLRAFLTHLRHRWAAEEEKEALFAVRHLVDCRGRDFWHFSDYPGQFVMADLPRDAREALEAGACGRSTLLTLDELIQTGAPVREVLVDEDVMAHE